VAGASDFPHSRQDVLARDVMSPQKGHILWEAKPRTGGLRVANSFDVDARIKASLLRSRSRKRQRADSISNLPTNHRTAERLILCKIAHSPHNSAQLRTCPFAVEPAVARGESEQSRPSISTHVCDHHEWDEHLLSLFQRL